MEKSITSKLLPSKSELTTASIALDFVLKVRKSYLNLKGE